MSDHFPVRFLKRFDRYNAGELAGFSPAVAERLIKDGFAEKDERKIVQKPIQKIDK